MRLHRFFPLLLSALWLGCSSDPAAPEVLRAGNSAGSGGTSNTGSSGLGGTSGAGGTIDPGGKGEEAPYPSGPFGLEVGDIVQNFKFTGLRNPAAVNFSTAVTETIALSDYYNPNSDPTKPRFLVVTSSARWCTFCKQEAVASMKPDHYPYWKEKGVEFLVTLFDNETPGEPATFKDLEIWTKTYKITYPSALDPNPPKLGVFFNLDAAPFNMILDLKDM
ncbi:MAG: hypothetical protein RMJ98_21085, partial [Myxococcales bacterium]|nr:hypothetical protein [Myxococcales bacterium]